jgi:hypothetical protein
VVVVDAVTTRMPSVLSYCCPSLTRAWDRQLSVTMDYNTLESAFIICSVVILMSGLVFSSGAFTPGTFGYYVLEVLVCLIVGGSSVSFSSLVAMEVYRSFKNSHLHDASRRAEIDAMEQVLRMQLVHRRALAAAAVKEVAAKATGEGENVHGWS